MAFCAGDDQEDLAADQTLSFKRGRTAAAGRLAATVAQGRRPLRPHDRIVAIEGDRPSVLWRHGGDALDEVLLPGGAAVAAAFEKDLPGGAVDLGDLRADRSGQVAIGVERALDANALAELADVRSHVERPFSKEGGRHG